MRKRQLLIFRYTLVIVLVGAFAGLSLHIPGGTRAAAYQGGNLLQNPGFEAPYVTINGDPLLSVASNWQPWSLPQGSSGAINARPEYKAAPTGRVRSGSAAQEYNTFFATHTGGVYQRVPVAPNTELRFSVYIYVWSSATFANPDLSEDPNDVKVQVGIDPAGGTDGTSANIVWSSEEEFYDQYREVSATATSRSTAVTVFVRSAPAGFVGTNNIYLDDAALVPLGQVPPPATETFTPRPPSATPDIFVPTQEGTITPSPTSKFPTPVPPTSTPALPSDFNSTLVYTVQAGDTVSAIAQRYGSTIQAIASYNGLANPGFISIGQVLIVPVRQTTYQPPPTLTPAPSSAGDGTGGPVQPAPATYTVQRGDTLYAIAARFNTTVTTLAGLNNILNPSLIYPGQVLTVSASAPAQPSTPAQPAAPAQPQTHVVQVGENLFRISLRYGVSMDALARANGIFNRNLIFPGQTLTIPQ